MSERGNNRRAQGLQLQPVRADCCRHRPGWSEPAYLHFWRSIGCGVEREVLELVHVVDVAPQHLPVTVSVSTLP